MHWLRYAEIAFAILLALSAVAAVVLPLVSIIRAYRSTAPLRELGVADERVDRAALTPEQLQLIEQHWERIRHQMKGYGEDLGVFVNPLRSEALDLVKEAAIWARLGIQYSVIANGAALAALPYLLGMQARASSTAAHLVSADDATWAACWFAGGLLASLLVCVVAYIDFSANAAIRWSNSDLQYQLVAQRHFDTEMEPDAVPRRERIRADLLAATVRTGLAGIWLALLAWFNLAWGTIRLIISLDA